VWYWKGRTLHFPDKIKIKVLRFMHIIARAEFQDRGSEHEQALEFHPNKSPDYHLGIIGTAAYAVVTSRSEGPEAFDLREVAELATNFASGLLEPGDAAFRTFRASWSPPAHRSATAPRPQNSWTRPSSSRLRRPGTTT
jgi:hypothetical protein